MIVQSIETFATERICIVRLRCEDGSEGYGQTAPFHADLTAKALHGHIAPHVLGVAVMAPEWDGE